MRILEVELRRDTVEYATVEIEVADNCDMDDHIEIGTLAVDEGPEWEEDECETSVTGVTEIADRETADPTHCPSCDKVVSQSWKFCPSCGTAVALAVVG